MLMASLEEATSLTLFPLQKSFLVDNFVSMETLLHFHLISNMLLLVYKNTSQPILEW